MPHLDVFYGNLPQAVGYGWGVAFCHCCTLGRTFDKRARLEILDKKRKKIGSTGSLGFLLVKRFGLPAVTKIENGSFLYQNGQNMVKHSCTLLEFDGLEDIVSHYLSWTPAFSLAHCDGLPVGAWQHIPCQKPVFTACLPVQYLRASFI